jgi:hypothetical protein
MAPVALIAVAVEVECENDKAVEFFEMPPRLWISNTQPLQACAVDLIPTSNSTNTASKMSEADQFDSAL